MPPYAKVIGDPVCHSRSPKIHRLWLEALGLGGEHRATLVRHDALPGYLAARRRDPHWQGCNVTAPLKKEVVPHLDRLAPEAERIGAVNCIRREDGGLVGFNSDADGINEALRPADRYGRTAAIIGGGGASRAALDHLIQRSARRIRILVRDPGRAMILASLSSPRMSIEVFPFEQARETIAGAATAINASPLGSAHGDPFPKPLLAALAGANPGALVFDMVYDPIDTPFLVAARGDGPRTVDGLVMLIGQARRAFQLFFGASPPDGKDAEARDLLVG